MRLLVVGASGVKQREVVATLLGDSHWVVVTSYKPSVEEWAKTKGVDTATAVKRFLKAPEASDARGYILEVVAPSFFEQPWVKTFVETYPKLIVIASALLPLGKNVQSQFDRVLISATTSPAKVQEYHALLLDAVQTPLTTLK
jgi:hypothetical protein